MAIGVVVASFDGETFYAALDATRRSRGLNWKQVAAQSQVSASTLTRMAQGRRPDVDGLTRLCQWAGVRADDFIRDAMTTREGGSTIAMISTYLRSDPHLTSEGAEMLESLIVAAYQRLKKE